MSIARPPLDAVLFDLDGTLIDSTDTYCRLFLDALVEVGLPTVPLATVRAAAQYGDFEWQRVLPATADQEEHEAQVAAVRRAMVARAQPAFDAAVAPFPGAIEAVHALHAAGLALGLVTSTPAARMPLKLSALAGTGVVERLRVVITADDVAERKPSPLPLLECAARLGVDPRRSAYVGDTRGDLQAARAAEMVAIGVLTGFDAREHLEPERPDALLGSIAELLAWLGMDQGSE